MEILHSSGLSTGLSSAVKVFIQIVWKQFLRPWIYSGKWTLKCQHIYWPFDTIYIAGDKTEMGIGL